jgi:hypothetical protein
LLLENLATEEVLRDALRWRATHSSRSESDAQIPNLARAARGLAQTGDSRPALADRLLPKMDEEAAFVILSDLVCADVRSPETVWEVQEWLQPHSRKRGYTPLMGALRDHPVVWKHLMASGRLDRRILMDYRNCRPAGELP